MRFGGPLNDYVGSNRRGEIICAPVAAVVYSPERRQILIFHCRRQQGRRLPVSSLMPVSDPSTPEVRRQAAEAAAGAPSPVLCASMQ